MTETEIQSNSLRYCRKTCPKYRLYCEKDCCLKEREKQYLFEPCYAIEYNVSGELFPTLEWQYHSSKKATVALAERRGGVRVFETTVYRGFDKPKVVWEKAE